LGLLGLSALGVPAVAAVHTAGAAGTPDPARVSLVDRFAMSGVMDVVPGAEGLYVLRQVPFPGDASGSGWQVDRVNSTTGHIFASASGDADPRSLLDAFGSVWVTTTSGAMPGGLGPGIVRLDGTTLAQQVRMTITPMAMAATSSRLWVLAPGDPAQLEALDPATNAITQTKRFAANDFVEGLTTTSDRVFVSYEPFGSPGGRRAQTDVAWIDPASLETLAHVVVARASTASGVPRGAYSLASTNNATIFVGLLEGESGPSLVMLRGHHVVGVRGGLGYLVTASPDGTVWATGIYRHKGGADTSDLERIDRNGTVTSRLNGLSAIQSLSAVGHRLYAGSAEGVLVFEG
jgi:hypothetical protein